MTSIYLVMILTEIMYEPLSFPRRGVVGERGVIETETNKIWHLLYEHIWAGQVSCIICIV